MQNIKCKNAVNLVFLKNKQIAVQLRLTEKNEWE